jgi:acyl-CoA synthetase (NDP forming)
VSARAQRYLRRHGFRGSLFPVNPRHSEIFGEQAFASLANLPEPVDHAFILVPTRAVLDAVAACGDRGIRCATVLAGGFADQDPAGGALQDRLVETARAGGVRLLGPNSMGLVNVPDRVALTVSAALQTEKLLPGGIGLLSQPATSAILLFLGTIREPARIEAMARRAADAGKPVIAYKLGRSEAGSEVAASHTGALAGSDAAAAAFLGDCGILRVDMLETLFEIAPLVAGRRPSVPGRRTAAVVTTAGGPAAMVIDRLALAGVDVVAPPEEVVARLASRGVEIGRDRLTDVTLAGARPDVYGAILEALLASPHCEVVIAVVGSSAQFHPELVLEAIAAHAGAAKPLAVFLAPQADESLTRLARAGVAAFRTPEACADGVRAMFDWRPPSRCERSPVGNPAVAAAHLGGGALGEDAALAVFEALGVPAVATRVIRDLDALSEVAAVDLYPAVAKILSPDIAHKAEVGGVVLPIADEASLRAACRQILGAVAEARPQARRAGILVQRLETGLAEALVGYRVDPIVGPIVAVGVGGVAAESWRDVVVRRAPVSLADAEAMVGSVRGFAALRGEYGRVRGDCDALARAVCAVSDLARLPDSGVREAEINPLVVRAEGDGVVAVDSLVVRTEDSL